MKKKENLLLGNQEGFTLIEIIAVLVILGILAAVAVPKYITLQDQARIKAADAAIAEVKSRLSIAYGKYLLENGTPPADITTLCNFIADTDILPAGGAGEVKMGGDFTAMLTNAGVITVTIVGGVTMTAPVPTSSWSIP